MTYVVKSYSPIYNYYIEEYANNCGYCDILKREFITHADKKYCEWHLTIKINMIKKFGFKKDINNILKTKIHKSANKYWRICKAR